MVSVLSSSQPDGGLGEIALIPHTRTAKIPNEHATSYLSIYTDHKPPILLLLSEKPTPPAARRPRRMRRSNAKYHLYTLLQLSGIFVFLFCFRSFDAFCRSHSFVSLYIFLDGYSHFVGCDGNDTFSQVVYPIIKTWDFLGGGFFFSKKKKPQGSLFNSIITLFTLSIFSFSYKFAHQLQYIYVN